MADSVITPRCDYTQGLSPIPGANWGLSHTAYLQLISSVPSDGVISHFGRVFLCPVYKEKQVQELFLLHTQSKNSS